MEDWNDDVGWQWSLDRCGTATWDDNEDEDGGLGRREMRA